MTYIVYLLKISYHILIIFALLFFGCYFHFKSTKIVIGNSTVGSIGGRKNIAIISIIFLGLFEAFYSFICGPLNEFLQDRSYYAFFYEKNAFNPVNSMGVYYLMKLLNHISNNPYLFFCVAAFIYVVVIMIAINIFELPLNVRFMTLLCIGLSQCLLYGCYQIKQALATAFAAVSIAFMLKNRKIPAVITLVLAILFHEVAWILVPIYVLIIFSDRRIVRYSMYVVLFIFIVGFEVATRQAIQIITSIIPSLQTQLSIYVDATGAFENNNTIALSIIKGIPFYWLLYYCIKNKVKNNKINDNYYAYYILLVIVVVTTLLTAITPWAWRFAELLYIPVFIFASEIYCDLSNKKKKEFVIIFLVPLAFFTFRKLFMCYFLYGGLI